MAVNKNKRTLVDITQKSIDNGIPESTDRCPIAIAVKETLTNSLGIKRSEIEVDVENGDCCVTLRFPLPSIAQNFVKRFDEEEPFPEDFGTKKYQNGKSNPAFKRAVEDWKTRAKPFSFKL